MKKMISALAVVTLLVGMTSVAALAHCGGGRRVRVDRMRRQPLYELCTVENCTQLGIHQHDGEYYCCPFDGTGHGCGRWR